MVLFFSLLFKVYILKNFPRILLLCLLVCACSSSKKGDNKKEEIVVQIPQEKNVTRQGFDGNLSTFSEQFNQEIQQKNISAIQVIEKVQIDTASEKSGFTAPITPYIDLVANLKNERHDIGSLTLAMAVPQKENKIDATRNLNMVIQLLFNVFDANEYQKSNKNIDTANLMLNITKFSDDAVSHAITDDRYEASTILGGRAYHVVAGKNIGIQVTMQ